MPLNAGAGAAATNSRRDILAWVLTPRGALTIWFAYVLANALIRYLLSHTLMNDDVSESLLTQTFQLGYVIKNPPLWEWLLWTIQQAVGPGFESHLLLRYVFIALLGVGIFRACRAATGDDAWSAAITLSSPLFYQIGWPFFEWGTHTLALTVVCLFTFEAAMRYVDRPSFLRAILFGALFGLGFLSKYGFAVFAISLVLALLVERETRVSFFRFEFLLVPFAALVVLSPLLYWLIAEGADLAAMTRDNLVRTDAPHLERSLHGLMKLMENSLEFLMPWAVIGALAFWQGRRLASTAMTRPGLGERLLRSMLLFGVAMAVVGIAAIGPTNFSSGYVVPILIGAVPYSAALLSRSFPGTEGARRIAVIAVCILVAITLLRVVYLSNSGFPERSYRREMWPIAGLADEMRAAGLDRGTLVVVSSRDGGNLRAALPSLRVVTVKHNERLRPSIGPDQSKACRLIWNATESIAPGIRWARTGDERRVEELPQVAGRERRHFDIPWASTYLGKPRTSRWTIVELDPDDPLCR